MYRRRSPLLFAALDQKHRMLGEQTSAVVSSHVTDSIKAGLRQCQSILVDIPGYLLDRLQSVVHSASPLVNGSRWCDHVSS